jgi:Flp pilus assembly protein protease CpaA
VTLPLAIALAGSTISAICDLRTGRVPNRVTYSLWAAAALLLPTRAGGEWSDAAVAVILTAAAVVPLYARGLMGGGDAKLLVGLAALDGSTLFWSAAFCSFALGGVAAACMLAARRSQPLPFAVFVCAGQAVAMAAHAW